MWCPDRSSGPRLRTLLGCAAWGFFALVEARVVKLEAEAILPIDSAVTVEPSGLCLRDGTLFCVSDDTDDTVFRLVWSETRAELVPALKFQVPDGTRGPLDLEGIVAGPAGSYFLLSEAQARVLQVTADGSSRWVTPSVAEAGRAAGFFRAMGGGLEGMVALPEGGFLLFAERQPRGWLEVSASGVRASATLPRTAFGETLPLLRLPDFTGADWEEGTLYTLFRNADLITSLERGTEGWEEGPIAWSFGHLLAETPWAYQDRRFGMAEGLAVDAERFYVVLDNNRSARVDDPADRRPLFLVLRRD